MIGAQLSTAEVLAVIYGPPMLGIAGFAFTRAWLGPCRHRSRRSR